MDVNKLVEAARDLRYLLDRGYKRERVLDVVVERYMLSRKERSAIYRCVHSSIEVRNTIHKLSIRVEKLAIDLFNCLLTILAMIRGDEFFLCDDCLVRDVRGSKIRYSDEPYVEDSMRLMARAIELSGAHEVVIVAERQVSKSAEYAYKLVEFINHISSVSLEITDRVDKRIIEFCKNGYAVATTDTVIIERCSSVYPLTTICMRLLRLNPLLDFATVLGSPCLTDARLNNPVYTPAQRYEGGY